MTRYNNPADQQEILELQQENKDLRQAVADLRDAYFAAMGVDYISDLPCEDLRCWLKEIEKLLE